MMSDCRRRGRVNSARYVTELVPRERVADLKTVGMDPTKAPRRTQILNEQSRTRRARTGTGMQLSAHCARIDKRADECQARMSQGQSNARIGRYAESQTSRRRLTRRRKFRSVVEKEQLRRRESTTYWGHVSNGRQGSRLTDKVIVEDWLISLRLLRFRASSVQRLINEVDNWFNVCPSLFICDYRFSPARWSHTCRSSMGSVCILTAVNTDTKCTQWVLGGTEYSLSTLGVCVLVSVVPSTRYHRVLGSRYREVFSNVSTRYCGVRSTFTNLYFIR